MTTSSRTLRLVLTALALVALIVVPTALAAKGGGGGNGGGKGGGKNGGSASSLALVMVDDANVDGLPNYGETITFDVSTTATTEPYVNVVCSQGGSTVYGASAGFFDSYPWPWTRNFKLSSSYWTGGAADCSAELYFHDGRGFKTLATIKFSVAA